MNEFKPTNQAVEMFDYFTQSTKSDHRKGQLSNKYTSTIQRTLKEEEERRMRLVKLVCDACVPNE